MWSGLSSVSCVSSAAGVCFDGLGCFDDLPPWGGTAQRPSSALPWHPLPPLHPEGPLLPARAAFISFFIPARKEMLSLILCAHGNTICGSSVDPLWILCGSSVDPLWISEPIQRVTLSLRYDITLSPCPREHSNGSSGLTCLLSSKLAANISSSIMMSTSVMDEQTHYLDDIEIKADKSIQASDCSGTRKTRFIIPGCLKEGDEDWPQETCIKKCDDCNHVRSYEYYIESMVKSQGFVAFPCSDKDRFDDGKCFPCADNKCPLMGSRADRSTVTDGVSKSKYFLKTGSSKPFGRYSYTLDGPSWPSPGFMSVALSGEPAAPGAPASCGSSF
ncbi:hypothetical protein KUCAC02_024159 [Chaenocephalus aceratus]|uniref:Uncharacterized protein n=1 Tax=Chaenocephalus aceratus TaxID=36190 RepID=A0ACB9WHY2_CHAAC|nr:hypothetical protein KUCAC02_024159 [Chaenocephalus aceratus]